MWIIPQHHKKIERFYDIISLLNEWQENGIQDFRNTIISKFESKWDYKWRQNTDKVSAANHNIDEPFFYWFIYKFNKKVFISKYGKILYDCWNNKEDRAVVLLFSLFNIQYYHPAKKSVTARLFPFRLVFSVLCDERIWWKLSWPEFYFLYQIETLDESIYENLIKKLLKFRRNNMELKEYFRWREDAFVKTQCSVQYFIWILKSVWIFIFDDSFKNESISSSKRRDATSININNISLSSKFLNVINLLNSKYSIFEIPRSNAHLPSELISEIYNYVDEDIYKFISIWKKQNTQLAQDIYNFSIDSEKCYEFEEKINEAWKLFYNIKSEVVWGSWEPDFVAAFFPEFPDNSQKYIFTWDAKSTKNQLQMINAGRIRSHMQKYKSNFSIIVTPKYSPASKNDIRWENMVILSSLALSEVTRQIILNNDKPSFQSFYNIIINNFWQDISEKFYKNIDEIYGYNV